MDDHDRWIPVKELGAGAFGQVHLAWDRGERRWVAVKRFTGQDELGLLRFVIESRIKVDHPHLVRSLAFRLVDDDAVLVTELARGGSLRQLMSRAGPLPGHWVATAVGQVLGALAALHANGVVHRDLKPANLLLRDAGSAPPHVLVADFGIATWRTVSLTGVGAAIGTPGYLAPEYLDAGTPSPRSDLFAVGVLAAELLAGRRLVHQSNANPDIQAGWSTELPMPSGLPPHLAAVLRRMADPDPAARYLDCVEAAEALRHAMPSPRADQVPGIDLLDGLPAGWTAGGPALTNPASDSPAHGGPAPGSPAPSNPAHGSPISGGRASSEPTPGSPAHGSPAHGSPAPANPAPSNPALSNPAHGSPASGGRASSPASSPTPGGPAHDGPAPATHTVPMAPPSGPIPVAVGRPAKPPKKPAARRVLVALTMLIVLVGGGIVWLAMHRAVPGAPTPGGTAPTADQTAAWHPEPIAQCALAERGAVRAIDGRKARCQRTAPDRQDWVAEPEGGFPVSNPSGPFPGEPCGTSPDNDYSPAGLPLHCTDRHWVTGA